MILHSIEVSGWRCFLENTAIGPFSDHLNVIFGPNGTGKSKLFEALQRGLMDSHVVTGQDISDIRPWGRALSPQVVIKFSSKNSEYRLTKRFLDGKFSRLERKEGDNFRPLAENKAADDFVHGLFSQESPGRGLSQRKHWGLAQVLWAPQGELGFGELTGDIIHDIHTTLGAQLTNRAAGPIEERAKVLYSEFYTHQGKVKSGKEAPPVAALQADQEKAKQERAEAIELLARAEAASRKVEDLAVQHRQLEIDAGELEKLVANARVGAERYKELKATEAIKRGELEKAEAQYRELKRRIEFIEKTKSHLGELGSSLAEIKIELPLRKKDAAETKKLAEAASVKLEKARKSSESIDLAERTAIDSKRYVDSRDNLKALGGRISKIEGAEARLSELNRRRTSLIAPDSKTIKQLRKLFEERNRTRELMEAAMLRLEISPEADARLDVIKAEELGTISLSKGENAEIKGSPEILAVIKGVARLKVSGPAVSVEEHRTALKTAEAKIDELSRAYGKADLDVLEDLFEKVTQLDGQIRDTSKEIEALCTDIDKAALRQEASRMEALISEIGKDYPGWRKKAPDPDMIKREVSETKREYNRKVKDAESEWDDAARNATSASGIQEATAIRLEDITREIKKTEQALAEATPDGEALEPLRKESSSLALAWDAAKEFLNEVKEKLEDFGGDPGETLKRHEKNLRVLQASVQKVRDDQRATEGSLDVLVSSGPYSKLVRADEHLLQIEEGIRKEKLRMGSAKLLYETLTGLKSESLAAVVRPVEEAAARLMHRISGRRVGTVSMGDKFVPSAMSPESAEYSVTLENLSGGEREQLYLSTRLALADVLAKDERLLVVLDDVLTATDTGRLARILSILEEAAARLQILILTCHPERYRSLDGAQFFDLEALIARSARI